MSGKPGSEESSPSKADEATKSEAPSTENEELPKELEWEKHLIVGYDVDDGDGDLSEDDEAEAA